MVLVTVASSSYLEYLERFLASANLFLPDSLIHAVLINVDELQVSYLQKLYSNLKVEHQYIKFNQYSELNGYCGNLYANILPDLMAKYNCPIIYIDCDSLFVSEAKDLFKYAKEFDISFEYNEKHPSLTANQKKLKKLVKGPFGTPFFGVINSAIITTNNSSIAKDFFIFNRDLINQNSLVWFADQESLFLTFKKFKDKINFNNLEEKYCSRTNKQNTIIWMAKEQTRLKHEYFQIGQDYINKVRKRKFKVFEKRFNIEDQTNIYSKPLIKKVYLRIRKTFKVLLTGRIN